MSWCLIHYSKEVLLWKNSCSARSAIPGSCGDAMTRLVILLFVAIVTLSRWSVQLIKLHTIPRRSMMTALNTTILEVEIGGI